MAGADDVAHDIQSILSSSERDYLVRNNDERVLFRLFIFIQLTRFLPVTLSGRYRVLNLEILDSVLVQFFCGLINSFKVHKIWISIIVLVLDF